MAGSVIGIYIPEEEEKGRPEYIERGSSQRGWIYKNPEAFYSGPFAVCYVPELSDCTYTGVDFLKMSLGQPEIAEEMFLSVGWQHPETWLDEQFRLGELDVCEKCGRIYQSYDEAERRVKLEEFACNILLMHAQELQSVYKKAFFDSLRLGHKVF